jgi:hypothetical protein
MTSIRFIQCPTRRPGESSLAFVDRMLAELNNKGSASALPTPPKIEIAATTAKVAQGAKTNVDRRVRARADSMSSVGDRGPGLGTTKHWPPLPGQRYRGAWPPAGLRSTIKRDAPGVTLPLDNAQTAWLQRYAEKYPNGGPANAPDTGCNPWSQITLAEAKAREARQLTVSSS